MSFPNAKFRSDLTSNVNTGVRPWAPTEEDLQTALPRRKFDELRRASRPHIGPVRTMSSKRRSTKKRCVCSLSKIFPLCDGRHQSEGWRCGEPSNDIITTAFMASPGLVNLADRLAHRFNGTSLHLSQGDIQCNRLVIITDGHDLDHVRANAARVSSTKRLVLGVGLEKSVLSWAFPDTELISLVDEPNLLWIAAEQAVLKGSGEPVSVTAPHIFLSHAVDDESIIFPVIENLRDHFGLKIFVCADSIPSGSKWRDEINRQLNHCGLFLFMASQHSAESVFCAFEAGSAMAMGKEIRLINLDGASLPSYFQDVQAMDVCRLLKRKPWLTQEAGILESCLAVITP